MAYEHLCMYCFEDLQGQAVCPHCGRDSRAAVPQIQMLPGTLVYHQRFLVGRALGQDATGIVYSAFDTKRENKLRLREYLPRDCAERLNDGSVVPMAGLEEQFERGMKKLRASVEGVEDPKKRHFYFEENGTAYIAQRKSSAAAAAAAGRDDEDDEGGSGMKQIGLVVGIAAAVVVIAAVVIVSLVNGALRSSDDLVQNPTLSPSSSASLWAPEVTASPTPYVSPTFAALVDPEQSWMDYTYTGDVDREFQNQQNQSATKKPTAKPTLNPSGEDYDTVNGKSDREEIEELQERLVELGWLKAEGVTGKYDSDTKQAVKDFQNYVNSAFQPAEKLSVDGIAGPKTQQWLYATNAVKPTPAPTPLVTPDPARDDVIDKDSAKGDIKMVQQKLIVLGLMEKGTDDGVYGTTTTAAVKKFQQRVNQLQGYDALPVSGTVDPDTLAYLNYYVEWWLDQQQATATPEPVLPEITPAPTDVPTPVPTDAPEQDEGGVTVNPDSDKESIAFVQEMLIGVGLLKEGADDGVYGKGTTNAVIAFQEWVNRVQGEGTLSVTGFVDPDTLNYLEYAYSNGMTYPTPEPEATAEPDPTEEPAAVPVKLEISVGGAEWNDGAYAVTGEAVTFQWSADGPVESYYVYVYDQDGGLFYENEATDRTGGQFGADSLTPGMIYTIQIGALPANGGADDMSWTEASFYVPGAAQPDPTDAPTPEPTAEPDGSVTPESGKEAVAGMQSMLIKVGLLKEGGDDGAYGNGTKNAVALFQQWVNSQLGEEVLEVSGIADAQTMKYLEHAVNNGMTYPTPEPDPTAEPTPVPTDAPEKDEGGVSVTPESEKESIAFVQRMLISVGLLNEGGDDGDYGNGTKNAVSLFQQWVNSVQGEGTLTVSGLCDADTLNYLEYAYSNGMTYPAPEATDAPAPEVTAEPEPTDAPEVTEAPAVQPVKLSLSIGGAEKLDNGVHAVTGDAVSFEWAADGAVDSYYVYVYDQDGGLFYENEATDRTSGQFGADALTPGMVYTIRIGALPAGGDSDDMSWTEAYFGVKKPAATEAPTPEPTDEPEPEPTEKPEGAKPEIAGAAYNDKNEATIAAGMIDLSWTCDVDAEQYGLVIYHIDDVNRENPLLKHQTEDSFATLDLTAFEPGTYRLMIAARVAGTGETVWSSSTIHISGE